MALRRGFKNEAQKIANEVRAEMGLSALDRLDPWQVAEYLDIPILGLSDFQADAPFAAHYFSVNEPESFSAVTVFYGYKRTIVHNDSHAPVRQVSNVAHELGHALLMHPPTPALNDYGCREWNQDIEDEANFLGPLLLVSDYAAVQIVLRGMSHEDAAQMYGVSVALLRLRLNMSGAYARGARIRGSHSKTR